MDVLLEVPDDITRKLEAKLDDLPRYALEALAVEAYRSGVLTALEVQQMLGLPSRWDTDAFLKQKVAYLDYSEDDLRQDIEVLRQQLST